MGEARRRGGTWQERAIERAAPDSQLERLPVEHREVVFAKYLEMLVIYRHPLTTRLIVGRALDATLHEPGELDVPMNVFATRLRWHVQIWRSLLATATGRPPFGPQHMRLQDGTKAPLQQVICRVCGCRWTVNAADPNVPVAIGMVPVVGPITQLADVPPGSVAPIGTVKCWVCVEPDVMDLQPVNTEVVT